jgi:hypothetical protein
MSAPFFGSVVIQISCLGKLSNGCDKIVPHFYRRRLMIDNPQEEMPVQAEEIKPTQVEKKKPALTVVIQSWWTPALAVLALVVGLLLGYFGRPLLNKGTVPTEEVAVVTTPAVTDSGQQVALPTTTVDPTAIAASQQQLMEYLISKTTQFKGDPNAAVSIIEFSDYQ